MPEMETDLPELAFEFEPIEKKKRKAMEEEIKTLRKTLNKIHLMASEDIREGLADGTSLFQIEADARAMLARKGETK